MTAAGSEPALRVEGLTKVFADKSGPKTVLHNIDLDVASGETVQIGLYVDPSQASPVIEQ